MGKFWYSPHVECNTNLRKAQSNLPVTSRAGFALSGVQKNFVIGVDNCICVLKRVKRKTWGSLTSEDALNAEEVSGARDWVNKRVQEGHYVCFFSSRPERLRKATESWLKARGFKYHSLVMGKPVADSFHYIDDRHVQATTFRGRYSPLVKEEHDIQVFC